VIGNDLAAPDEVKTTGTRYGRLLLVDGNNIFMRGLKVMGVELSAGDIPTGPLLFFINSLARHIRNEQPDTVMVCWDAGRAGWRAGLSPAYKAHRPSGTDNDLHFQYAARLLDLAGIPQCRIPGWEGDDLIAGYAMTDRAEYTVIVSDDNDMNQLVSDRVVQAKISAKSTADRFTYDAVVAKWGGRPSQVPYLKALMGDTGDGVAGLRGIGPKKAAKMLDTHQGSWPAVLQSFSPEDRATVLLGHRLMDLRHPSPELLALLPDLVGFQPTAAGMPAYPDLYSFLRDLQMSSVLQRLEERSLWQ
jgi:DNA polymerase-1